LDNDSGVRAAGGYWDWDTEGCSSDDERDDSVETEEEIAALERRLAAMKDELAWLEMQSDASMGMDTWDHSEEWGYRDWDLERSSSDDEWEHEWETEEEIAAMERVLAEKKEELA